MLTGITYPHPENGRVSLTFSVVVRHSPGSIGRNLRALGRADWCSVLKLAFIGQILAIELISF